MKWFILFFLVQLLSGFIMGQVKTPDLEKEEPAECPGDATVGGDANEVEVPVKCREKSLPEQEEQIQSEKSESTTTIVVGSMVAAVVILLAVVTPLPRGAGRGWTSGSHDIGGTSGLSGFVPW
ncbi:uncharacterized protein LOC112568064 [Pomacea canaliculata]|uniref:uncharacterized protein LOC112568064 n=1 Tax=Pomacea canaliculata TaxID=400727 RepID=UPI000D73B514|nr:uncharacterized protein LOC112568064 [Pomacea canaliculata]